MAKKDSRIRADFRKNRTPRTRQRQWKEQLLDQDAADKHVSSERVSGKGDLTRRRTIVGQQSQGEHAGLSVQPQADAGALAGRVVSIHGLTNLVETEDGRLYQCATRRLLKTLLTDQRHVVAVGDRVVFRPAPNGAPTAQTPGEGIVEGIEPRHGTLSRTSKGRQQIIVTNVDQALLIASAAQPAIKPHLIDRMLIVAEKTGIRPMICVNKVDLVDAADLQPLVGVYSQLGYLVLLSSAVTGQGIERLRRLLRGRQSVVVGQSGVGKSSLLNAVEQGFGLQVREVSEENEKGRHTTTTARLLRLTSGGYVVDTPGIRQFELWDTPPEEVAGFFRDLRPFVSKCRFPDCTHRHEADCAVKNAVADDLVDARRYESYCHFWDDAP